MDQQPAAPDNSTPLAPAAAPIPAVLPSIPAAWPGAFGIYKYSANVVKLNAGPIVLVLLLTWAVALPIEFKFKLAGQIIAYIIGGIASVALTMLYLAGLRGQRLSFGDAVSNSWPFVLRMIGLTILVTLTYILSMLLFVIPFFFVFPRLSLVNYFLIDKKLGILDSCKASWAATKGHSLKVWGITGATLLMALLMITILGIPVALYLLVMYSAATAVLYEFLGKASPSTSTPAPVPGTTSAGFTASPPTNPQPPTA